MLVIIFIPSSIDLLQVVMTIFMESTMGVADDHA
jgi:hypothetical protein